MFKEKKRVWKLDDTRSGLFHYHMIDSMSSDIARPGRLPEVMPEMERIGIVKSRYLTVHPIGHT